MKSEARIRGRIVKIEGDDRYQSGLENPAVVAINAPLALIQVDFEAEIRALKWVLKSEEENEE